MYNHEAPVISKNLTTAYSGAIIFLAASKSAVLTASASLNLNLSSVDSPFL